VHAVGGEVDQQVAAITGEGHGDEGLRLGDIALRVCKIQAGRWVGRLRIGFEAAAG